MQASIFLARLMGPVLLVVGIALFINRDAIRTMADEFLSSRALIYLAGIIAMPAGLAVVLTHNVWTADWRVLITLFGWLGMIGGAVRLIAPQATIKAGRTMLKQPMLVTVAGALWLAVGLLLCFFGYLR